MSDYCGVKKTATISACFILAAAAAVSACKPQSIDVAQLDEQQKRNALLRQEIADMQILINRVGDSTPDMADRLDARDKEVAQAYAEVQKLKEQETAIHMRRLELEARLDSFRSTFRELQNQVANSAAQNEP